MPVPEKPLDTDPSETDTTTTTEEPLPEEYTIRDDPLMASMRDIFGELLSAEQVGGPSKKEPANVEEGTPASPPEGSTEEPPEGEPAKPAVSVTRTKPVTRDELAEVLREIRTPAPVTTPPAAAAPLAEEHGPELTEEEKDHLEVAEHAAKLQPEKYKDLPSKLKRFYKDQQDYLKEHEDEFGRTFDEQDEAWVRFLNERRPFMSDFDRRKVERDLITRKATEAARVEFDKERQQLEARTRRLESQPLYEGKVREFGQKVGEILKPSNDADKLEEEILTAKREVANNIAATYWQLKLGYQPWDAQRNPIHAWIGEFVKTEAEAFVRGGGKERFRDGKHFLPPHVFNRLPPQEQVKAWTFGDEEILERIQKRALYEAQAEIKAEGERRLKQGWGRTMAAPRNGKPDPTPLNAPNTGAPSRAPGVAHANGNETAVRPAADIFEIRGLPLPGTPPID